MVGMKNLDAWSTNAHVIYMNHILWFSLLVELVTGIINLVLSVIFCSSLTKKYAQYPVRIESRTLNNSTTAAIPPTNISRESFPNNGLPTRSPQIFFENQKYNVFREAPIQMENFNHSQGNSVQPVNEKLSSADLVSPALQRYWPMLKFKFAPTGGRK